MRARTVGLAPRGGFVTPHIPLPPPVKFTWTYFSILFRFNPPAEPPHWAYSSFLALRMYSGGSLSRKAFAPRKAAYFTQPWCFSLMDVLNNISITFMFCWGRSDDIARLRVETLCIRCILLNSLSMNAPFLWTHINNISAMVRIEAIRQINELVKLCPNYWMLRFNRLQLYTSQCHTNLFVVFPTIKRRIEKNWR